MPKKRTYEQLERALKRAKQKSVRTKRAYNSYLMSEAERAQDWRRANAASEDKAADRVAEVEAKNDKLETALKSEGVRILTLGQEVHRVNTLRQEEGTLADKHRAEAAELNLIHFRVALGASNKVNLGLLDLAKLAATPALLTSPKGISLGSIKMPKPKE